MLLNYKIYGELDSKPPVIMLHGLLGSLDNWNGQAKLLQQHYTVITVDLRNHGHSPHVSGMSYREMAADIVSLLEHLAIEQCYLLGHSMGGKVAMTLALSQPQFIKKLIIVDIAPKAYKPRHLQILQAMLSLPLDKIKTRKDADQYLAKWIHSDIERSFLLKNLKRNTEGFYWQCYLSEIVKHYLKISGFVLPKSTHFLANSLFIRGGLSDYIQDKDIANIQQVFPSATIETLEHSGHLPHIEEINRFYQLVLNFLQAE